MWIPGTPSHSPLSGAMKTLKMESTERPLIYKLLIGGVVPRPIALVSTLSSEGKGNLAPFSFYNGVSTHPPAIVISITQKADHVKKDTLINIEQTGQFTVNFVSSWMAEAVNHCSATYPHGVDEMKAVGLTPIQAERVRPPRVGESPLHFECELLQTVQIGDGTLGSSTLVIGKIVLAHVAEEVYDSRGHLDITLLDPISRLGGLWYGKTRECFELARPEVSSP